MNTIQVVGENTYYVQVRGQKITVKKNPPSMSMQWSVFVDNASARAWRNGFASSKWFDTLEEIETKYKSLKGLVALHTAMQEAETMPLQ